MERPDGHMSLELFKKIIDDSQPEVSWCWLHLFGEPLSNKYLPEMIAYARTQDVLCGISTNGIGLTEKRARKLGNSGLNTIIVSLDAVEKETYDKIRRGGDFDKVVKNIETFLSLSETKNIENVIIQMIKFNLNINEVDRFIEKWRGRGRKVHIKDEETWAGYFAGKETNSVMKRIPCRKLWERLTIDWAGNVSICCRDYKIREKVGNVTTESLKSIWNGKRMIQIRKLMVTEQYDKLSLCKNCIEWKRHLNRNFTEY
jgi:radical SAM protein with 4Fe4S-binding SPASM domain